MEVEEEKSVEQNSMEELKIEDENVKDISMEEDILGAQSLLMSESDDDNIENSKDFSKSPLKKVSPKRSKRIDSDNESDKTEQHVEVVEEIGSKRGKREIIALIDSDSDESASKYNMERKNKHKNRLIDSESENDIGSQSDDTKELVFKDNNGVFDQSTEHQKTSIKENPKSKEDYNLDTENKQSKKSPKKLIKLKSATEEKFKNENSQEKPKKLKKNTKKSVIQNPDSESRENEDILSKKKISPLVDSESEAESRKQNSIYENSVESFSGDDELVFKDNEGVFDKSIEQEKTMKQTANSKENYNADTKNNKQTKKSIKLKKSATEENSQEKPKKLKKKTKKSVIKESSDSESREDADILSKNKISSLVDSEYEAEYQNRNSEFENKLESLSGDEDELVFKDNEGVLDKSLEQPSIKRNPNSKENYNADSKNNKHSKKSQIKSIKLKSATEENLDTENSQEKPKKLKKKSKKSVIKESSASESSENEDILSKKKISSLVDSESEAESLSANDSEVDLEASAKAANFEGNNNEDAKEKDKKHKVMRASAKKALDEMQAIQSEQQRLHREAHISIPYHKPKKHTLQEFLKRRTIIQPQLTPKNGSPAAAVGHMRRIKMTSEEMEEYAKLMEERAREAKEFFKSESEDEYKPINEVILDKTTDQQSNQSENEEELVFKGSDDVLGKPTQQSKENEINSQGDNTHVPTKVIIEEDREIQDAVQITEAELDEILTEGQQEHQENEIYERPSCSKVIITEVIELPKLDMNTVKISPVKNYKPRPSINIKQLLNEKDLSGSPSLSGDPNKLIDLETGDLIEKKPSGIENLMQRLMTSNKTRKSKTSETCNILSTENGKLEMTKITVSLTESKDNNKEPKPWAAYFELKKKLEGVIKRKRLEEMHKKQEEELEYSKCLADDDYDEEEEEMEAEEYEPDDKPKNKAILVDDEENALEVEEDDGEEEGEDEIENVEEVNNEEENQENENDDYDEENDDEADDDESDDDDDDADNEEETTDKIKRKNRIIKAFADSDEEADNDGIDFLKNQPPGPQAIIFETQTSEKVTLEDEENELMALCSGTFETQKSVSSALMSQIPLTQNNGKTVNDDELMELCSGTFETQTTGTQMKTQHIENIENLKPKTNKIFSSDEEENNLELKENKQRVKKLTKKLKKKKAKLGFSDDEDDDDDDNTEEDDNAEEDEKDVEPAIEVPETYVDYDSEENEILVEMTKKDKVKQASNFFENEAVLSESEWGSADEDEKNLDKYDIELGDEDEFDKEKLRTELGQIHARKMLDDDLREVRKIQDMLFEDEENDGVGRQRAFKWKNAEAGFSLDDGPRDENADGENGDSGDEINEHQWRKIRYEREQFLKEQGLKPDSQDMSTTFTNTTIPSANNTTSASTFTAKKLHIITAKKSSVSSDSKKSSPFLISKGISAMHKKSVRGSFLVRDKETLNKLAGLTKGSTSATNASNMSDTAGTVSIKSIKAKNFVFATLTEEEHENLKRKADDLLNSSNENGTNFMKKPKIEHRRDKCFIDQLL